MTNRNRGTPPREPRLPLGRPRGKIVKLPVPPPRLGRAAPVAPRPAPAPRQPPAGTPASARLKPGKPPSAKVVSRPRGPTFPATSPVTKFHVMLPPSPWPQPLVPGVYFGLPAALHHADPGLGSGDIVRLTQGPAQFWWASSLNPDRPPFEPTDPMTFGSAMHTLVLEGVPAFRARYEQQPAFWLDTRADMVAWLADHGDDDPPRLKADCIDRVIDLDPKGTVAIRDLVERRVEKEGRTLLDRETYTRVVQGALLLGRDEEFAQAFTGGEPEVTIIYDRPDGVRAKARIDYLKMRASVDLKTIGNTRGMTFKRACGLSFANYRRDIQAEHYNDGRRALPALVKDGRVFGKVDTGWLREVAAQEVWAFVLIWLHSIGAPVHHGIKLSPGNPILTTARDHIESAIAVYRKFMADVGPDKMWLEHEPLSELDIDELPAFAFR